MGIRVLAFNCIKKWKSIGLTFVVLLAPVFSLGGVACKSLLDDFDHTLELRETRLWRRNFSQVKIFVPHGKEVDEVRELSLARWVELDFRNSDQAESLVGVTDEGQIYHLVHIGPEKTIGRKLSGGERKYKNLIYTEEGDLIAIDHSDQAYLYQSLLWRLGGIPSGFNHNFRKVSAITASVSFVLLKMLFSPEHQGLIESFFNLQGYEFIPAVLGGAVMGFSKLYSYESARFTESFVSLGKTVGDSQTSLLVSDVIEQRSPGDFEISRVEDYFLKTGKQEN